MVRVSREHAPVLWAHRRLQVSTNNINRTSILRDILMLGKYTNHYCLFSALVRFPTRTADYGSGAILMFASVT